MTEKLLSVFSQDQIVSLAQSTGFVKRRSKFSAVDFVKLLLSDQLYSSIPSLEEHSFQLIEECQIAISKQGLHKRFNNAALEFLKRLFESFLGRELNDVDLGCRLRDQFRAIKILDSTEFKLPDSFAADFPGYSASNAAACAAIQFEYDILSKKIHCLHVGSARESDKAFADQRMEYIEPGELILRDLGYHSLNSYSEIEKRGAFFISRLKPQVGIYTLNNAGIYTHIDWQEIAGRIEKSGREYFDQWVYIGKQQKHRVRLMAWLLPEDAQANRLRNKISKKGFISQEDKIWSRLTVLITNIGEKELEATQAYNLYRLRWQIEWVFKTWKSHLQIAKVRKMNTARLKCYLYAKFIWILLCWDITALLEKKLWHNRGLLVSQFKIIHLLKPHVTRLKSALFRGKCHLRKYFQKLLRTLQNFCIKDCKKNRVSLKNLIQLKEVPPLELLYSSHLNNKAISGQTETPTDGFQKNGPKNEEKNCPCG